MPVAACALAILRIDADANGRFARAQAVRPPPPAREDLVDAFELVEIVGIEMDTGGSALRRSRFFRGRVEDDSIGSKSMA